MKTPPDFSSKRSYERYRAELMAWSEVTTVKKSSWARIIALNMPDSSEEGDIRGKIFESLGDELAGEEGFQKLIDWLDKHFAQDKDIVMIDRIKQFMKFVRKPGMTIHSFFFCTKVIFWLQPQNFLIYSKLSLKNYLILQSLVASKAFLISYKFQKDGTKITKFDKM